MQGYAPAVLRERAPQPVQPVQRRIVSAVLAAVAARWRLRGYRRYLRRRP
jgi:hypothetical protein